MPPKRKIPKLTKSQKIALGLITTIGVGSAGAGIYKVLTEKKKKKKIEAIEKGQILECCPAIRDSVKEYNSIVEEMRVLIDILNSHPKLVEDKVPFFSKLVPNSGDKLYFCSRLSEYSRKEQVILTALNNNQQLSSTARRDIAEIVLSNKNRIADYTTGKSWVNLNMGKYEPSDELKKLIDLENLKKNEFGKRRSRRRRSKSRKRRRSKI